MIISVGLVFSRNHDLLKRVSLALGNAKVDDLVHEGIDELSRFSDLIIRQIQTAYCHDAGSLDVLLVSSVAVSVSVEASLVPASNVAASSASKGRLASGSEAVRVFTKPKVIASDSTTVGGSFVADDCEGGIAGAGDKEGEGEGDGEGDKKDREQKKRSNAKAPASSPLPKKKRVATPSKAAV